MRAISKSFLSCFALAGLALYCPQAAMAEAKVGFVSTERVLRDAAMAKAAQKKLEGEFSKREKEIQELATKLKGMSEKLERDAPVISEADRGKRQREITDLERDLQRRQREFREDLNQRRNEELAVVVERANKAIRQIAESEKYDIIFQEAVYASPRIDITEKVLRALNGQAATAK
ncbi:MAG: OmpH family outer membrane protein [Betaproteobacteria bacterium]|nr:OmpH family outer membrane protein [Betaproteobacteria bacterium]NBT74498.1 OmpH family outer membrane protein [Betaproteobacteria bacterium]NBY13758.1 OmpH family outer membrane protein [Betaproteobacteria bacterium]NCA15541.1 OmpH family outer membrane protein [Betaproteobacteria bacterium]NDF03880.1 OmpH family outer membrane protein [Betaproteobacteria bacterium]